MPEQWKQVINYFRTNIVFIATLIFSFSLLIFAEKSPLPGGINVFIGLIGLIGVFTSETFLLLDFHPVITFITSAILVNFCGGTSLEGNLASFIGAIGAIGCLISAVRLFFFFHPGTILVVSSIFLLLHEKLPISESLGNLISGIALISFLASGGWLLGLLISINSTRPTVKDNSLTYAKEEKRKSDSDGKHISLKSAFEEKRKSDDDLRKYLKNNKTPFESYSQRSPNSTNEKPSFLASFLANMLISSVSNSGKVRVSGYRKNDGTFVKSYFRKRPRK